jgi:hypothetical protein
MDRCLWLMSAILATQGAEIRQIIVQSQLQANSSREPTSKKPITKTAGGMAQIVRVPA